MKLLTIFLILLLTSSCKSEVSTSKKEKTNLQLDKIEYPCVVAHKADSIKVENKTTPPLFYTILYNGGNQAFDNLRLIVSEFDISKYLTVDINVNYSSEEDKKN